MVIELLWNVEWYFPISSTDKDLQPYLQQIDQLEDGVQKLEAAAYKLDSYSKQLGRSCLVVKLLAEISKLIDVISLPFLSTKPALQLATNSGKNLQ